MQTRLFFPGFYELVLAIPLLATAEVAHAQCNNSDSPQPTAAQTVDYSNQTFSLTNPYYIQNAGESGCDGASHGDDTNGDPGSPGQSAGTVDNSATNVTISGPNSIFGMGGVVGSSGGNGGNGGNAGSPVFDDLQGGNGGIGGAGGALTVNFLGTIGPDANSSFALVGLQVDSEGGSGGNGGGVGTCCEGDKNGGDGGNGGAAAMVQFTGSGQVQAANQGIVVQSLGGNGGAGASVSTSDALVTNYGGNGGNGGQGISAIEAGSGSGGQVSIGLTGTNLTTTGQFAPAIYAQSLGGGGGLIAQDGTLFSGGAGGTGSGAVVSVTLVSSTVSATGDQSSGIVIQTNGTGSAAISIDAQSSVTGGAIDTSGETRMAAAIYIQQGNGNSITNSGKIVGAGTLNPTAVLSDAAVQITNTGTITGAIVIGGNENTLTNSLGGTLDPGASIALGTGGRLVNAGTLHIGGVRTIGATTVSGDVSGSGKIVFDADFVQGVGDKLVVNGTAKIAGVIEVNPSTMRNATLALVSASGGVTLDPALTATQSANQLFTYNFTSDGTTLYTAPQAQFAQASSGLGNARAAVGDHLQAMFNSGELFDTGFTALANLASPDDYANTLESLTGQALGAIAAWRYQASRRFVSDVNGACETAAEDHCTWARVQAGHTKQGETADALGYNARHQIFEMGAQIRISDGLYLGGALAYEHSKLRDSDRTAQTNGNSILGAIGLHYRSDRIELVGSVDAGYGWYTSNRQISVGNDSWQASASPRLWNLGAGVAASYHVPLGTSSYLKPFAEVRGTKVHANAYSEKSTSVFALDVLATSDFAISSMIGTTLGTTIDFGEGASMKPFVIAAAVFSDDTDWKTSARFVGESGNTDPFTVQTRSPGTFGRFGIGAELSRGPNFAFSLSYNPEFGNHYTNHQGVARLTYRF